MTSVSDIRKTFISYFNKNDHEIVRSSSLVPDNDPSLMFVNSGMVQFKNIFTGQENSEYKRAVTSQKCVRAGGKHNDLENVGHTARHHTFFEMLGNFSFGDYFKEKAIYFAWDLLTKEFGFSKDKLLVTYYHDDIEAKKIWKNVSGLDDKKIIAINTNDNFWSMGDTGPCGPCSEIFYDHGESIFGGPPGSKNEDGDRYIEIWNLVFMQFEQLDNQKRINLPRPSIDTGMGLERLAAILQGKHDNYDIDLMDKLITSSAEKSSTRKDGKYKVSHRVIIDHLRSSSFLIADGILPSNEGRGYVLRRIMRRGMRHAHILGCKDPLLCKLVPDLIEEMGDAFPELIEAKELIYNSLETEENKFKETLERGIKILDDETKGLTSGQMLDGKVAFKLYDTYGFPFDLTQDILKSKKININEVEFKKEMNKQKKLARSSWKGSGDISYDKLFLEIENKCQPTNFVGYDNEFCNAKVLSIIINSSFVNVAKKGTEALVVFDQTPFYATSGGQLADKGKLNKNNDLSAIVLDCDKTKNGVYLHKIFIEKGNLQINDNIQLSIDANERKLSATNHTSTHILHQSLKDILGKHISQKGSLVSSERLRFDFSHNNPLTRKDLFKIEDHINKKIRDNSEVLIREMEISQSKNEGATALFGEKYGDIVRVVSFGKSSDTNKSYWSIELCGGTHVKRTGEIGLLKIISEGSVSSGIRRIEAITGTKALEWVNEKYDILKNISELMKSSDENLVDKIISLNEDKRKIEKEFNNYKNNNSQPSNSNEKVVQIGDVKFISKVFNDVSPKNLKGIADKILYNQSDCVVAVITIESNKISLVVGVTSELSNRINAVDLVKIGSSQFGGKGGGGRPMMAQSGGNDINASNATIEALIKHIKKLN